MEIIDFLIVSMLSAIKFLPGFLVALGTDLSTLEVFFALSSGGIIGVMIFSFFGNEIRNWVLNRNKSKEKKHPSKSQIRRMRFILRVWKKYGIYGIAFLTPPVLSPPIGAIIAVVFGEKTSKIIVYLGISCIGWGLTLALLGNRFALLWDRVF